LAEEASGAFEGLVKAALTQPDPVAMANVVATRLGSGSIGEASSISRRSKPRASDPPRWRPFSWPWWTYGPVLQAAPSLPAPDLRKQVVRDDPRLAETWSRFEAVPEAASGVAIAKISLLIETFFLLNRELKDAGLEPEKLAGADVALKVLSDIRREARTSR